MKSIVLFLGLIFALIIYFGSGKYLKKSHKIYSSVSILILSISFTVLITLINKNTKESFDNLKYPYLIENEASDNIYGNITLSTIPSRNPFPVSASDYILKTLKNGIPIPFQSESEYESAGGSKSFNLDTYKEQGLLRPELALRTPVIDPSRVNITFTEPSPNNSSQTTSNLNGNIDLNTITGPDTILDSIPGPNKESSIPAVQIPINNPFNLGSNGNGNGNGNSNGINIGNFLNGNGNGFKNSNNNRNNNANAIANANRQTVSNANQRIVMQKLTTLAVQAGEANAAVKSAQVSVQSQNYDTATQFIRQAFQISRGIFDQLTKIRNTNKNTSEAVNNAFNVSFNDAETSIDSTSTAQDIILTLTSGVNTETASNVALAENMLSDANLQTSTLQNSINSLITAFTLNPINIVNSNNSNNNGINIGNFNNGFVSLPPNLVPVNNNNSNSNRNTNANTSNAITNNNGNIPNVIMNNNGNGVVPLPPNLVPVNNNSFINSNSFLNNSNNSFLNNNNGNGIDISNFTNV